MKNQRNARHRGLTAIAFGLVLVQIVSTMPVWALGHNEDQKNGVMQPLISETDMQIAQGVQQKNYVFTNPQNYRTACYAIDVDLNSSNTGIVLGTPNDGTAYNMQTVRDQANAAVKNGKKVVAAVNADYYNMATGEPNGAEIKDGKELHTNQNHHEPFFGILKTGKAIIGDSASYESNKGNLKEAVGGPRLLVKDGTAQHYNDIMYPCTAVAIRGNGSVFFVVIDGAQYPYSTGIRLADLADMLVQMGAKQGLMLDGGGSATCLSRTPGTTGLSCQNRPSDGWERKVANSLLVVSNTVSDGKFASAFVTPQDKTYMPNAKVQMQAVGLDAAGVKTSLPTDGLSWSLSDDTFGTIDEKGLFVSTGKTGVVKANLSYQGKVVGSTNIEIAVPDQLYFSNTELSFKLGETKSLGLTAQYHGRDVVVQQENLNWNVPKELGQITNATSLQASSNSASGKITVTVPNTSLSANLQVTIGQPPHVMCDFESENGYQDWYAHPGSRNETCSISLSGDGEPVWQGQHSLKFTYDFTKCQTGTTLSAYAGPAKTSSHSSDKISNIQIPGSPTAIGMWVYATPEMQRDWLWTGLIDSTGRTIGLYLVPQDIGVNWTGWKYVEAKIPTDTKAPYYIWGGDAVSLLATKSGQPNGGQLTKGSFYVDNIRAVYGEANDDTVAPSVTDIKMEASSQDKSQVDIKATVKDDAGKNATGIDFTSSKILVDGKDYSKDKVHFNTDRDGYLSLHNLRWANGTHKVTVIAKDNFGNETTKDDYFTVDVQDNPGLFLSGKGDQAILGGTYQFRLSANSLSKIKSLTAVIQIPPLFQVKSVKFADSGTGTWSRDNTSGKLTINFTVNSSENSLRKSVQRTASSIGADNAADLADITVLVPSTESSGSSLECSLDTASMTLQNEQESFAGTVSSKPISIPITSNLQISFQNPFVNAGAKASLQVQDLQGNAIPSAEIKEISENGTATSLGTTDDKGYLSNTVAQKLIQENKDTKKKFKLQAEKDNQYSVVQAFQIYTACKEAKPSDLLTGTTEDPTTQKSITWMTNPMTSGEKAQIRFAPAAEFQDETKKKTQMGTSKNLYYDSDSNAVRENAVVLTGLKPGTKYTYQVGDGTNWSQEYTFSTLPKNQQQFTFHVFGDTQSVASGGLDALSNCFGRIEKESPLPAFNLHVGDFVDDEQVFSEIDNTAKMFNQHPLFNSIDMVHVLGNHEYEGDDGSKGRSIYGTPVDGPDVNQNGCYSTNYGNLHISVIGWTSDQDTLQKELDWLRKDVKSAGKTWNIVATHQPVFNKNEADPSTLFYDNLPAVCDELGIDFVISGHDHSYGRTYAFKGGKQDPSGTVYISAGHTAEKTYDIHADPQIFACNQSDKNERIYLTCTVSSDKFTITAKDLDTDKVIDSYTTTAKGGSSGDNPSSGGGSAAPAAPTTTTVTDISKDAPAAAAVAKAVSKDSKAVEVTADSKTSGEVTVSVPALKGQQAYVYVLNAAGQLELQASGALQISEDGKTDLAVTAGAKYVLIPANEQPPVSSVVGTVEVAQGYTLPFDLMSGKLPNYKSGNAKVGETTTYQAYNKATGKAVYGIYGHGAVGDKVGIYANGVKLFVMKVTKAPYWGDTTVDVAKKQGQTYWFKVKPDNANAKVSYTAGNGMIAKTLSKGKQADGSYLFGFCATGKSGQSTGLYATIDGKTFCVFHVNMK